MKVLNEKEAGKIVQDKSIAVVGNAKSIFNNHYGFLIDAHDIIIRFNAGIPTNPKNYSSLGRRTDILAGFKFLKSQWEKANRPVIWYRGPYNIYRKPALHREWEGVQEWRAYKHREDEISKYLTPGKGPSNGVMLLEVLVNLFKPFYIRLFGFDFFNTQSWYPGGGRHLGGGKYHDGEGEEYYIRYILGFELDIPGVYKWSRP